MRRAHLLILGLSLCWPHILAAQAPVNQQWQDETIQILSGLVKIDTSNPPGNETKAAQYIKNILTREGIASEIFESVPGRGSLVARLKGNGRKRPLLLMGHIDVVGVERGKWSVDPFAAVVKDGYLYGRGAHDDKGNVACNLEVFLQLHRAHVSLDRDVIFLAEGGEEGTSEFGMDFMVNQHWDQIDSEFALNEGGGVVERNGQPSFLGIETTEKIPRALKLTAHGSSGHGSIPRLDNAITHLAAAVAKVGNWQSPMKLNETTRAFFQAMAGISPPQQAALLTHLEDPAVQEKLRSAAPAFSSMLRTSIVPTMIAGGFRVNVIPSDAEATLDVRALPDEDMDALLSSLKRLIDDPSISISPVATGPVRPSAPPSSLNNDMYNALRRAGEKVYPGIIALPTMQTGATDSAQLRAKGVQAYGIGIGLSEAEITRIHGNDERTKLDEAGKFVQFLYAAVIDVAAAK